MCGRFAQIDPITHLISNFLIDEVITELAPSYNIAPGQSILSIVQRGEKRFMGGMQWGIRPSWSRGKKSAPLLINARSETIGEKPAFKESFRQRRCLIPASGFYEWKRDGAEKVPYYISLKSGAPFLFAGIYDKSGVDDTERAVCAIITTESNELLRSIHNRMPVIIGEEKTALWLNPQVNSDEAKSLLCPYPPDEMEAFAVSQLVNSPENNSPECIKSI